MMTYKTYYPCNVQISFEDFEAHVNAYATKWSIEKMLKVVEFTTGVASIQDVTPEDFRKVLKCMPL